MKILRFLLRASRGSGLLAILFGSLSGLCGSSIVALITELIDLEPAARRAWLPAFIGLALFFPVASIGTQHLVARLSQGAVYTLRQRLTRRILATPLRRLEELGSHRLMTALTDDISSISNAVNFLPMLWINCTFVIGLVIFLAWLSWFETLILVGAIVLAGLTYPIPARAAVESLTVVRRKSDTLFAHFRDLTNGTKELQIHRPRRGDFLERFDANADQLRRGNIRAVTMFMAAGNWNHVLFMGVIGAIIFAVSGSATTDAQNLATFIFVLLFISSLLQVIMNQAANLGRADVALKKLETLELSLDEPEPVADLERWPAPEWTRLELVAVTHSYRRENEAGHETFTLGPIDLELTPGELIIVAGGNGSGKTTFVKLLTGLYTPESGEIRCEGKVVDADAVEAYRQRFSVVFSDFHLFDRVLGVSNPELDSQARSYLEKMELDHKVEFDQGIFSTIDLSQGQRKRLALLVSYLENRDIYVFDEWAADQDPYFKRIFYEQLLPELTTWGKTVVCISHDEVYHHVADRVVYLRDGRFETSVGCPAAQDLGSGHRRISASTA